MDKTTFSGLEITILKFQDFSRFSMTEPCERGQRSGGGPLFSHRFFQINVLPPRCITASSRPLFHAPSVTPDVRPRRLTLRFLGCCRSSSTCLRRSSRSRRLLYSIWLSSSVWCCRRIRSMRSFCRTFSCRYSSSCMDSSWRVSMACSISFWVFFLFSSWEDGGGGGAS